MDHYQTEQWILERHHRRVQAAERRARLLPSSSLPVRAWLARSLRELANRLDSPGEVEPRKRPARHQPS
jgi:hypothetical protein